MRRCPSRRRSRTSTSRALPRSRRPSAPRSTTARRPPPNSPGQEPRGHVARPGSTTSRRGGRTPNWWEDDAAGATVDEGRRAMPAIRPITMPKWGLAMEEGMLARWAVEEGAVIAEGQEIMDIETSKIANVFESPVAGVLRRRVVPEGDTVPVGALLGVVSDPGVPEAEVDSFVADFLSTFKPAVAGDEKKPTAE